MTRGDAKAEEREALEETGDYLIDEKHKTVTLTESGMAKAEQMLRAHLAGGHLYDFENAHLKHHVDQALRAHVTLQARRRLHGEGRPGGDRRRVHRPPDARPPLERRAAPGGRGQGAQQRASRGEDRAREPDAGDRHLPELLPQVQEALRHDRHRRYRGRGVREDLQPRRRGHPAQPPRSPASRTPISCIAPSPRSGSRSSPRSSTSTRRGVRCWSAPCRSRNQRSCRRCSTAAA